MSHTILLVQPNRRQDSRSYADFESVNEAMEGICKIYEEQLKKENSSHHSITYDIRYWAIYDVIIKNFSQLFDYIDNLTDLSVLVYQRASMAYAPYNKVLFQNFFILLQYRRLQIWASEIRDKWFLSKFHQKVSDMLSKKTNKSLLFDPFLKNFTRFPYLEATLSTIFAHLIFQDWIKEKIYIMLRKQAGL